ncbi:MAG: CHAD domain-containing protein, partial [Gemmatimonadales bacterium]
DPADAEAMHDFRTELRRLRTLLRAYRGPLGPAAGPGHRNALRQLASATASARDLEVQLSALAAVESGLRPRDKVGLKWLVRLLRKAEQQAEQRAEAKITGRLPEVSERLSKALAARAIEPSGGPTLARATALRLAALTDNLEQRLDAARTLADQAEAHAARIAAKRIRYLLEPFAATIPAAAALVAALKALQDLLGRMHDSHVLATTVAHHAEGAFEEHVRLETRRMREGRMPDPGTLRKERRRDPLPGLREIARRAGVMQEDAWKEFQRDWLDRRQERLLSPLRGLARKLGGGAIEPVGPGREIERKYLLRKLPPRAARETPLEIEQGYLPGTVIQERLRRVRNGRESACYRTIKFGRGVARDEAEETTSEAVFEAMWPLTEGRRLTKRRYRVRDGDLTWEIDAFDGRDLVLAEVELSSEEANPTPPPWLAPYIEREVTGEDAYVNLNLAT